VQQQKEERKIGEVKIFILFGSGAIPGATVIVRSKVGLDFKLPWEP
jgi:hypothetical protein